MRKYDVIIVGGGVSGASTAYYLAQKGVDVLMVEKETFPRDKVCGEGIAYPLIPVLQEMGVLDEVLENSFPCYGLTIWDKDEKNYSFYNTTDGIIEHGLESYCCARYIFDDIINRNARKQGIGYIDNFEATEVLMRRGQAYGVRGIHNGKIVDLECNIVVLASGSHSMLAQQMGFYEEDPRFIYYGLRGHYENCKGLGNTIHLAYPCDEILPGGYIWLFPMSETKANVGVFITEEALQKWDKTTEEVLDWWRNNTKFGQDSMKDAELIGELKGWRLPCGMRQKIYADGIIAVGDSGNMVEEFLGNGIINAFQGGAAAAKICADALEAGDYTEKTLSKYMDYVAEEVGPFINVMRTSRDMVFSKSETISGLIAYANENYADKPFASLPGIAEYIDKVLLKK